jgi:hypothetical protein
MSTGNRFREQQLARALHAIHGAIYLDFANQVGLREAVGLVLDSEATDFDEAREATEIKVSSVVRKSPSPF